MIVPSRFSITPIFLCALFTCASWVHVARCDPFVFVLNNGGRVEGDWLNMKQRNVKTYLVQTRGGGKIALDRDQVKQLERLKPGEIEYAQIAPTKPDTVVGHWEMAEWCRLQKMTRQRAGHLQRILDLEPDHAKARYGLGYHQVDGRWVTREGWREEQGLVAYRGAWRTPQEVDMVKRREKHEAAERDWIANLRRLRKALATERAPEAYKELVSIKDPHAVRALREAFKREHVRGVKMAYIKAFGNIPGDAALIELVNNSLDDPDVEIFHACLDQIADNDAAKRRVVPAYIKGLKNIKIARINRSAQALERLEAEGAIAPLIDALVTTHKVVMSQGGNGSQGTPVSNTFFKPGDGGSGFSTKPAASDTGGGLGSFSTGTDTQVVPVQSRNSSVLQALVRLSGASFGYDQQAWKNWYALEKKKSGQAINARGE